MGGLHSSCGAVVLVGREGGTRAQGGAGRASLRVGTHTRRVCDGRAIQTPVPGPDMPLVWDQPRHDRREQDPTEPHTGCSAFLLSFGGAGGGGVLLSGL